MSPAEAEPGSVTVKAELVVLQKYPSPATAVNAEVLIVDCHSIPKPVAVPLFAKVAPEGIDIVSPEAPIVIVSAFSLIILLVKVMEIQRLGCWIYSNFSNYLPFPNVHV